MRHNELYHHGIKGMRWGVRRYQNEDGSLTPAGQKHLQKIERKIDRINVQRSKAEDKLVKRKATKSTRLIRYKKRQANYSAKLAKELNSGKSRQSRISKYSNRMAKYTKKVYKLEKPTLKLERKIAKSTRRVEKLMLQVGKLKVDDI